MSVHIEHVVTEVIPESESNNETATNDKRWSEQMKLKALMKRNECQNKRLRAEAFDD